MITTRFKNMKNILKIIVAAALSGNLVSACQQSGAGPLKATPEQGMVSGKATDAKGSPLKNVNIELSHTVWSDKKLRTRTDANGFYSVTLPAEPRGNWTIQATYTTAAYGENYVFILDANDNSSFGGARGAIRNFTWKLLGEYIGGQYGAQVDVQALHSGLPLTAVKLILSPADEMLADGSEAKTLEKKLEKVNGKYRAGFVPVGKYTVQAVYEGRPLNISSARNATPKKELTIVFHESKPVSEAAFNTVIFINE
jgi:hypothetical protein